MSFCASKLPFQMLLDQTIYHFSLPLKGTFQIFTVTFLFVYYATKKWEGRCCHRSIPYFGYRIIDWFNVARMYLANISLSYIRNLFSCVVVGISLYHLCLMTLFCSNLPHLPKIWVCCANHVLHSSGWSHSYLFTTVFEPVIF